MKTPEQFSIFFNKELLPLIEPLEEYRKENYQKLLRYLRFSALTFILDLSMFLLSRQPFVLVLFAVPFLISFGKTIRQYRTMSKYMKYKYKYSILSKAIRFYFDDFEYIAQQKIAKTVLTRSLLFPNHILKVTGEDFMRFKIGQTSIMFCETTAYKHREQAMFNGIFISSTFNKYFNSKTFIISKNASSFLLKIKRQLFSNMQNVDLENSEFERQFYILSKDQVEARYILSTSFMQRILHYKNKTHKSISFSFINNRLYCIIPQFTNLFEAPIDKTLNLEFITKAIEPVILYTDLVEDLNLNLRIWSK